MEVLSALSLLVAAAGRFVTAFVMAELDWRNGTDRGSQRRAAIGAGIGALALGLWTLLN
ncbi:MAG: hypothetical protein JO250_08770 [Armatimonadetes bacterium]|nr:hypothetical protein [Armatimonadota bacterium]